MHHRLKTRVVRSATTLGVALTCLVGTAAHADSSGVTVTSAGQQLSVGSVAAIGQLVDGTCVFPSLTTVTLSTQAYGATTTLKATDACELVVTAISKIGSIIPATVDAPGANPRRTPKRDPRFWTNAVPAGGIVIETDPLGDLGTLLGTAPPSGCCYQRWLGHTQNTMFNPTGAAEWEDSIAVLYFYDYSASKIVWGTETNGSFCTVYDNVSDAATPNNTDTDDCRMGRVNVGDDGVVYQFGSGRYYQSLLVNELYPTNLSEEFTAWGANGYTGNCSRDRIPPGWTFDCTYWRDAVTSS